MAVLKNFEGDVTVITVNRRLADYLCKYHATSQVVDILSLDDWIQRCWQSFADPRTVLNNFQENIVFKQIIKEISSYDLLNINATTEVIQQAWQLMRQWELSVEELGQQISIDTLYFVSIYKKFNDFLLKNNCIDSSYLATLLREIIKNQKLKLPARLVFAGFDQFTPQILKLITVLKQKVIVDFLENTQIKSTKARISFVGQMQEIYAMARWAKQQLLRKSGQRLGCVVPNLITLRDSIETIFHEVFYPESSVSFDFNIDRAFNFSAGKNLNAYPLINTALELLRIGLEPTFPQMNVLLHSAFLSGSESEFISRAMLAKQLQEMGEIGIGLRTVLALARDSTTIAHCPILANNLQAFFETLKSLPLYQMPSHWSVLFKQQLQILGWPGERTLNSEEYQTLQRWQELLQEFSSLDNYLKEINMAFALDALQQLASTIIFQPKTSDAPIQILGTLEAVNIPFDHLWIMGLTDQFWPPFQACNPYLPAKLQQQLKMPHANAEQELEFYKNLMARFCHNAQNIIFSYPLYEEDRALRPSSLITSFPEISTMDLDLAPYTSIDQLIFASRYLETIEDSRAPVLSPEEIILGGSGIFKLQAACPFSAFAKFRLGAEELNKPQLGLNYRERGLLLHATLENIWNILGDQQQLKTLSAEEQEKIVLDCIDNALLESTKKKPLTLKKYFTQVERQRLKILIDQWLDKEKQRAPFTVVSKEQAQKIIISNIPIQVRIDRIDRLADGTHLIVDYKTGKTSIEDWSGARPNEPQLPLYCITSEKPISGLAFAQVRIGDMRFNGMTVTENCLPQVAKISTDWQLLINDWKTVLTQLGNEFFSGKAEVAPKDDKKTCQYCELKPLCRIYERH